MIKKMDKLPETKFLKWTLFTLMIIGIGFTMIGISKHWDQVNEDGNVEKGGDHFIFALFCVQIAISICGLIAILVGNELLIFFLTLSWIINAFINIYLLINDHKVAGIGGLTTSVLITVLLCLYVGLIGSENRSCDTSV